VGRYAAASGLSKETVPSGKKSGGEIWAEGSDGVWVAVPFKKYLDAWKTFDGEVAKGAGDRDTESKSDNGGEIILSRWGVASVAHPKRLQAPCRCHLS